MTIKHILFDANVLVTTPPTHDFLQKARNSPSGTADYIRCHCIPGANICFILEQIKNKGIEIIVISKNGGKEVLNALKLPYDMVVADIGSLNYAPEECGYVTRSAKVKEIAASKGYQTICFAPGMNSDISPIMSLIGYKKKPNH